MPMLLIGLVQWLDGLDRQLTSLLNFDGGGAGDLLACVFSSRLAWVPWGMAFLYALAARHRLDWRGLLYLALGLALAVCLCDQVSSSVFKPLFMRLRPSHDPALAPLLHYVGNYRGGLYGFVSSHSANAWGVTMYAAAVLRERRFTLVSCCFSLLVAYSRVYLGVHYVGDVLCGALLGLSLGWGVARGWLLLGRFLHARLRLMPWLGPCLPR